MAGRKRVIIENKRTGEMYTTTQSAFHRMYEDHGFKIVEHFDHTEYQPPAEKPVEEEADTDDELETTPHSEEGGDAGDGSDELTGPDTTPTPEPEPPGDTGHPVDHDAPPF